MRRNHCVVVLGAACAAFCFDIGGCGRTPLLRLCPAGGQPVDLTGLWLDGSKVELVLFNFVQDGNAVASTRVEPSTCDHRDGQGTTSQTRADFVGDLLNDCGLEGRITVCRFGIADDPGLNGHVGLDFTATLNASHDRLESRIVDPVTQGTLFVVWERLGCDLRPPEDFLLPGSEVIEFTARFNLSRGEITYVGEAQLQLDAVRRVAAGVTGAVATVRRDSPDAPVVVSVIVGNGNRIEYSLFGPAAVASVASGDAVNPSTEIGNIGRIAGGPPDTFKLMLQAFEAMTDDPVNPHCVEQ